MTGTRLPHSEIPGSKRACRSPRLIAACRVLHRLPSPRHPSCALTSLTTKKSIRIDCRISGACAHGTLSGAPVRAHFDSRSYACAIVKEPFVPTESDLQTRHVPPAPAADRLVQASRAPGPVPHPACLTAVCRPAAPFSGSCWWACLESNQGPRPYQGRALTN